MHQKDQAMFTLLDAEHSLHRENIELIASLNFVSQEVLQMLGSIFANKLAEGYPAKRYNTGCTQADLAEEEAKYRLKQLFNCNFANVQPHSGSQANQAVFFALLNPGDTVLGMSMDAGGHLTHGHIANISGKWFNALSYGVCKESNTVDFNQVEYLALKHKPKLIIAGHSSYPREIDFKEFRRICDKIGAYFLADISHVAGLIATKHHENPIDYADIITSTSHKTLRGPRGGIIMSNQASLFNRLDAGLFPGIQSAPLVNVIMAKSIAFGEALSPEFKDYIGRVILNAKTLAKTLINRGYNVLTNGTDNHIVMVDLRNKNLNGNLASERLSLAGITCNKNMIPFDTKPASITSGIRLGTSAATTRGLKTYEFEILGNIIADVLDEHSMLMKNKDTKGKTAKINDHQMPIDNHNKLEDLTEAEKIASKKVKLMAAKFSLY